MSAKLKQWVKSLPFKPLIQAKSSRNAEKDWTKIYYMACLWCCTARHRAGLKSGFLAPKAATPTLEEARIHASRGLIFTEGTQLYPGDLSCDLFMSFIHSTPHHECFQSSEVPSLPGSWRTKVINTERAKSALALAGTFYERELRNPLTSMPSSRKPAATPLDTSAKASERVSRSESSTPVKAHTETEAITSEIISQSAKEAPQSSAEEAPPLPNEDAPPLPKEAPPGPTSDDDGWAPVWDANVGTYYFFNRFTLASQWENPRVPDATSHAQAANNHDRIEQPQQAPGTEGTGSLQTRTRPVAGGYNPAIHGDYDPEADYAKIAQAEEEEQAYNPYAAPPGLPGINAADPYAQQASFNRFTGRFTNTAVHPTHTPDQHTDDAKSKRQMNAFFDVDAAANSHGGKSLRAERQERKLSKKELKQFQEKRRAKKEEKRRAWLKD
ncbi:hypothetical protein FH972_024434 [Carpinus fangiana]|uniref:WW domain-containing protein n=1 Tax=Carpinus fangiana TaxID=176857 RepID=A0A5N6KYX8_9ROSI|nr:hypothetical protein FH972_024434 [Carpinus fangiana]